MAVINIDDAYILNETGAQVDKVTGLFTKDEGTTEEEKAFAQLNIGASGGGGGGRNLLDNPFFTVRQRGNGPWTGGGLSFYTVDRWALLGSSPNTVTAYDGYISVASGNNGLAQYITPELGAFLNGKTVTLSVMDYNGKVASGTLVYSNTALLNTYQLTVDGVLCRIYCGLLSGRQLGFSLTVGTGNTVRIKAAKLELGSVSTLANDAPPDYAEELAKCKYYYRRIANQAGAGVWGLTNGLCVLSTAADFVIEGEMNKNTGSSAYSGSLQVNGQAVTGMTMFSRGIDDKSLQVTLRFGVGSGLTQYGGAGLLIGAGGYIEISHDL